MPAWLVQFAIHVALSFGVPFLLKILPLPAEVSQILEELAQELEDHKANIADSIDSAKQKVANHYSGK